MAACGLGHRGNLTPDPNKRKIPLQATRNGAIQFRDGQTRQFGCAFERETSVKRAKNLGFFKEMSTVIGFGGDSRIAGGKSWKTA